MTKRVYKYPATDACPFAHYYAYSDAYQREWEEFEEFVGCRMEALTHQQAVWFTHLSMNMQLKVERSERGWYGLAGELPQHHYYQAVIKSRTEQPYLYRAFEDYIFAYNEG